MISSRVKKTGSDTGAYMKMCIWAYGHTLRDHMRNDNIRERHKVDNITEKSRKPRLRRFGYVKRRYKEYVGRETLDIVHVTWEKKARKTEAEMDGLCQPGHESHRNNKT